MIYELKTLLSFISEREIVRIYHDSYTHEELLFDGTLEILIKECNDDLDDYNNRYEVLSVSPLIVDVEFNKNKLVLGLMIILADRI